MVASSCGRSSAGDGRRFGHLTDAELVCVRNANARLRRRLAKIKTKDLDRATGGELVSSLHRIVLIGNELDAEAFRRRRPSRRVAAVPSSAQQPAGGAA